MGLVTRQHPSTFVNRYSNEDESAFDISMLLLMCVCGFVGVKSGSYGHAFANNGNPDETAPYEPSHQDLHCLLS